MTTTTILTVTLVGAVVLVWAKSESLLYRQQKWDEAKSLATALSESWTGPLYDQNWSQLRLGLDVLLKQNDELVYILVSDTRLKNQIVAASPTEFNEQYVPDLVPLSVTDAALASPSVRSFLSLSVKETFVLRDVEFPKGQIRARRGERVIEVAADIRIATGQKIGTFRLGMSLREVDNAVKAAINQALAVGGLGLAVGSISAYVLAERLSNPVRRLQVSAAKIAAGDLAHRAEIAIADEIGALAVSFNEMSAALQASFSKLQQTLASFERFVPAKFLSVIAPEGIENIQVGVASIQTMTILFCDIRGYTAMSEQMTPIETFSFLNDYLSCMGQAIDQTGGFIDKYIGDAIMALFDDEATDCVLRAVLLMHQTSHTEAIALVKNRRTRPKIAGELRAIVS